MAATILSDINKALNVSHQVKTDCILVNQYANFPARAPFGGYKKSSIDCETSKSMLDSYTQMKNIFISTKEEIDGMY